MDWKAIIEEYGPAVWRRLFQIVGNEADASDCFQEVFLKAVQAARHKPIENLAGFLNLTATRCGIDCLRRRRRHPACSMDACMCDLPCTTALDPSEPLTSGELAASLRKGLSMLPSTQAEVFALQVFDELSYRQIADHLHIRENHVGVLINRAREKLRLILKPIAAEYEREAAREK